MQSTRIEETPEVTITHDNTRNTNTHTSITNILTHRNISDTIPHLRPGRQHNRNATNIDIHSAYGDSYMVRDENDKRIFFQNVKGLTHSYTGEDYVYYMTSVQAIGADIIGMAETNTAWQHQHLRDMFASRARKHYGTTKISCGYSDATTDPVPEKETFQSGGSLTMTTGNLVPMSHGEHITDPTGLGRWSGHTLRGKANTFLSIITAYQVCSGSIGTSPIGSAFSREYEHLRQSQKLVSPRPRKIIIHDLIGVITLLQKSGHTILLMMDSNAQLHDDIDL